MKNNETKEIKALVVNIVWSDKHYFKDRKKEENYPEVMEITIPPRVMEQRSRNDFMDIVESFTYNLMSALYGRCVDHCQIWLGE